MSLYNMVMVTCDTSGAGPFSLGPAYPSYKTFDEAGVPTGAVVSYVCADQNGTGREVGTGVYDATAKTLTRNVVASTNNNNPIVLSGTSLIGISPLASEILDVDALNTMIAAINASGFPNAVLPSPTLGTSNDRKGISFVVTTDCSNVTPGWSAVGANYGELIYQYGDHTNAFAGNGKTTAYALKTSISGSGAGQKLAHWINIGTAGAGDEQGVSINAFNVVGGKAVGGDEGYTLIGAASQQFANRPEYTMNTMRARGGGSTTTTAAITGSLTPQTVPVADSTGLEAGKWYVINNGATPDLNCEPVPLTAVGANTITGVFRLNQNSGVTVTPATVIEVDPATAWSYGQHQWLINLSGPTYSTGTISWTPTHDNPVGSGTAWTNNMVGGDAHRPGAIAAAGDQYGTAQESYYAIKSIDSTTTLTTDVGHQHDLVGGAGAYKIYPCALILRVVPGSPTLLVLESNTFAWANGDTIQASATGGGGNVLHTSETNYIPGTMNTQYQLDEFGPVLPQKFININAYHASGSAALISGANQSSIMKVDITNHGGINRLITSVGTKEFALVNIANGGFFHFDKRGIFLSGLVDNEDPALNRGGGNVQLEPVWNTAQNLTLLSANVTDTNSGSGSKLIDLQVGSDSKLTLSKAGALVAKTSIAATTTLKCGSYTVATLPSGSAGMQAFASDCRVFNGTGTQEGGGAGTGGLVIHNGTAWKIAGTNVTAVA